MKKKIPKISLILPVHNEEVWIDDAAESLLRQSFKDFEVIFSNDGSRDGSQAKIDSWTKKFPEKFFSVQTNPNQGEANARNSGYAISKGEIIIQTDADAIFPEDFLHNVYTELKGEEVFAISLGYLTVHPKLNSILANFWRCQREASYILRKQGLKKPIVGTFAYKRKLAEKVGPYRKVTLGTDYDFAKRVLSLGYDIKWAEKTHFAHADVSTWNKFFKRMYNANRHIRFVYKEWGEWLSVKAQILVVIWNLTITILGSATVSGIILGNSLFWVPISIWLLTEGILPNFLHRQSRLTLKLIINHKYWKTLLAIPLITLIRTRASFGGKLYAILWPEKAKQAVTFDV